MNEGCGGGHQRADSCLFLVSWDFRHDAPHTTDPDDSTYCMHAPCTAITAGRGGRTYTVTEGTPRHVYVRLPNHRAEAATHRSYASSYSQEHELVRRTVSRRGGTARRPSTTTGSAMPRGRAVVHVATRIWCVARGEIRCRSHQARGRGRFPRVQRRWRWRWRRSSRLPPGPCSCGTRRRRSPSNPRSTACCRR